jgi:hypothetical protein
MPTSMPLLDPSKGLPDLARNGELAGLCAKGWTKLMFVWMLM